MKKENIHRASRVKFDIDRINMILTGKLQVKLPDNFRARIIVEYSPEAIIEQDKERGFWYTEKEHELSGTMDYGIDFDNLVKDAIENLGDEIRERIQGELDRVVLPLKEELEKELDELLKG